jgi:drug/metabolite transporter (DMT)-like permease
MAVTLVIAMTLPFLLPQNLSLGPRWIIPAVEGLILVALVIADPGRIDRRSSFVRALSIGLVCILVVGAAGVTVRLVVDLIRGGPETNSPGQLIRVGSVVLVYIIITFSFLYWELDGGVQSPAHVPLLSSRISHSLSTSTRMSPNQGGAPSSSTICT